MGQARRTPRWAAAGTGLWQGPDWKLRSDGWPEGAAWARVQAGEPLGPATQCHPGRRLPAAATSPFSLLYVFTVTLYMVYITLNCNSLNGRPNCFLRVPMSRLTFPLPHPVRVPVTWAWAEQSAPATATLWPPGVATGTLHSTGALDSWDTWPPPSVSDAGLPLVVAMATWLRYIPERVGSLCGVTGRELGWHRYSSTSLQPGRPECGCHTSVPLRRGARGWKRRPCDSGPRPSRLCPSPHTRSWAMLLAALQATGLGPRVNKEKVPVMTSRVSYGALPLLSGCHADPSHRTEAST